MCEVLLHMRQHMCLSTETFCLSPFGIKARTKSSPSPLSKTPGDIVYLPRGRESGKIEIVL